MSKGSAWCLLGIWECCSAAVHNRTQVPRTIPKSTGGWNNNVTVHNKTMNFKLRDELQKSLSLLLLPNQSASTKIMNREKTLSKSKGKTCLWSHEMLYITTKFTSWKQKNNGVYLATWRQKNNEWINKWQNGKKSLPYSLHYTPIDQWKNENRPWAVFHANQLERRIGTCGSS